MCSRVYGEQTIGNVPTETSDTVRVPRGRAWAHNGSTYVLMQAPSRCVPGQGTLEQGGSFHDLYTSKNCSPKHQTAGCIQRAMGRVAQIAGCKTWQAYIRTTWGMSLNCLNVFPLASGHRLSRMAVKGFTWKACRLGIDTFDVPLLFANPV